MAEISFPLLTVSGPIGVGKTTIGQEISTLLDGWNIAHTFIDLDALTQTYPRPPDDRFGYRLAFLNLRDVWANSVSAGSRNLIVARVVETRSRLEEIERALPGCKSTICQLRASNETLLERVRKRELGSGRDWHERRALDLALLLRKNGPADFVVETDGRSPPDIASDIAAHVTWSRCL